MRYERIDALSSFDISPIKITAYVENETLPGWNNRLQVLFVSDRILEPAMQSNTIFNSVFAPIFGNSAGAGMALLYVGCAIAMFLVGAVGYRLPQLKHLDNRGGQYKGS